MEQGMQSSNNDIIGNSSNGDDHHPIYQKDEDLTAEAAIKKNHVLNDGQADDASKRALLTATVASIPVTPLPQPSKSFEDEQVLVQPAAAAAGVVSSEAPDPIAAIAPAEQSEEPATPAATTTTTTTTSGASMEGEKEATTSSSTATLSDNSGHSAATPPHANHVIDDDDDDDNGAPKTAAETTITTTTETTATATSKGMEQQTSSSVADDSSKKPKEILTSSAHERRKLGSFLDENSAHGKAAAARSTTAASTAAASVSSSTALASTDAIALPPEDDSNHHEEEKNEDHARSASTTIVGADDANVTATKKLGNSSNTRGSTYSGKSTAATAVSTLGDFLDKTSSHGKKTAAAGETTTIAAESSSCIASTTTSAAATAGGETATSASSTTAATAPQQQQQQLEEEKAQVEAEAAAILSAEPAAVVLDDDDDDDNDKEEEENARETENNDNQEVAARTGTRNEDNAPPPASAASGTAAAASPAAAAGGGGAAEVVTASGTTASDPSSPAIIAREDATRSVSFQDDDELDRADDEGDDDGDAAASLADDDGCLAPSSPRGGDVEAAADPDHSSFSCNSEHALVVDDAPSCDNDSDAVAVHGPPPDSFNFARPVLTRQSTDNTITSIGSSTAPGAAATVNIESNNVHVMSLDDFFAKKTSTTATTSSTTPDGTSSNRAPGRGGAAARRVLSRGLSWRGPTNTEGAAFAAALKSTDSDDLGSGTNGVMAGGEPLPPNDNNNNGDFYHLGADDDDNKSCVTLFTWCFSVREDNGKATTAAVMAVEDTADVAAAAQATTNYLLPQPSAPTAPSSLPETTKAAAISSSSFDNASGTIPPSLLSVSSSVVVPEEGEEDEEEEGDDNDGDDDKDNNGDDDKDNDGDDDKDKNDGDDDDKDNNDDDKDYDDDDDKKEYAPSGGGGGGGGETDDELKRTEKEEPSSSTKTDDTLPTTTTTVDISSSPSAATSEGPRTEEMQEVQNEQQQQQQHGNDVTPTPASSPLEHGLEEQQEVKESTATTTPTDVTDTSTRSVAHEEAKQDETQEQQQEQEQQQQQQQPEVRDGSAAPIGPETPVGEGEDTTATAAVVADSTPTAKAHDEPNEEQQEEERQNDAFAAATESPREHVVQEPSSATDPAEDGSVSQDTSGQEQRQPQETQESDSVVSQEELVAVAAEEPMRTFIAVGTGATANNEETMPKTEEQQQQQQEFDKDAPARTIADEEEASTTIAASDANESLQNEPKPTGQEQEEKLEEDEEEEGKHHQQQQQQQQQQANDISSQEQTRDQRPPMSTTSSTSDSKPLAEEEKAKQEALTAQRQEEGIQREQEVNDPTGATTVPPEEEQHALIEKPKDEPTHEHAQDRLRELEQRQQQANDVPAGTILHPKQQEGPTAVTTASPNLPDEGEPHKEANEQEEEERRQHDATTAATTPATTPGSDPRIPAGEEPEKDSAEEQGQEGEQQTAQGDEATSVAATHFPQEHAIEEESMVTTIAANQEPKQETRNQQQEPQHQLEEGEGTPAAMLSQDKPALDEESMAPTRSTDTALPASSEGPEQGTTTQSDEKDQEPIHDDDHKINAIRTTISSTSTSVNLTEAGAEVDKNTALNAASEVSVASERPQEEEQRQQEQQVSSGEGDERQNKDNEKEMVPTPELEDKAPSVEEGIPTKSDEQEQQALSGEEIGSKENNKSATAVPNKPEDSATQAPCEEQEEAAPVAAGPACGVPENEMAPTTGAQEESKDGEETTERTNLITSSAAQSGSATGSSPEIVAVSPPGEEEEIQKKQQHDQDHAGTWDEGAAKEEPDARTPDKDVAAADVNSGETSETAGETSETAGETSETAGSDSQVPPQNDKGDRESGAAAARKTTATDTTPATEHTPQEEAVGSERDTRAVANEAISEADSVEIEADVHQQPTESVQSIPLTSEKEQGETMEHEQNSCTVPGEGLSQEETLPVPSLNDQSGADVSSPSKDDVAAAGSAEMSSENNLKAQAEPVRTEDGRAVDSKCLVQEKELTKSATEQEKVLDVDGAAAKSTSMDNDADVVATEDPHRLQGAGGDTDPTKDSIVDQESTVASGVVVGVGSVSGPVPTKDENVEDTVNEPAAATMSDDKSDLINTLRQESKAMLETAETGSVGDSRRVAEALPDPEQEELAEGREQMSAMERLTVKENSASTESIADKRESSPLAKHEESTQRPQPATFAQENESQIGQVGNSAFVEQQLSSEPEQETGKEEGKQQPLMSTVQHVDGAEPLADESVRTARNEEVVQTRDSADENNPHGSDRAMAQPDGIVVGERSPTPGEEIPKDHETAGKEDSKHDDRPGPVTPASAASQEDALQADTETSQSADGVPLKDGQITKEVNQEDKIQCETTNAPSVLVDSDSQTEKPYRSAEVGRIDKERAHEEELMLYESVGIPPSSTVTQDHPAERAGREPEPQPEASAVTKNDRKSDIPAESETIQSTPAVRQKDDSVPLGNDSASVPADQVLKDEQVVSPASTATHPQVKSEAVVGDEVHGVRGADGGEEGANVRGDKSIVADRKPEEAEVVSAETRSDKGSQDAVSVELGKVSLADSVRQEDRTETIADAPVQELHSTQDEASTAGHTDLKDDGSRKESDAAPLSTAVRKEASDDLVFDVMSRKSPPNVNEEGRSDFGEAATSSSPVQKDSHTPQTDERDTTAQSVERLQTEDARNRNEESTPFDDAAVPEAQTEEGKLRDRRPQVNSLAVQSVQQDESNNRVLGDVAGAPHDGTEQRKEDQERVVPDHSISAPSASTALHDEAEAVRIPRPDAEEHKQDKPTQADQMDVKRPEESAENAVDQSKPDLVSDTDGTTTRSQGNRTDNEAVVQIEESREDARKETEVNRAAAEVAVKDEQSTRSPASNTTAETPLVNKEEGKSTASNSATSTDKPNVPRRERMEEEKTAPPTSNDAAPATSNGSYGEICLSFVNNPVAATVASALFEQALKMVRPGGLVYVLDINGETVNSVPEMRDFLLCIPQQEAAKQSYRDHEHQMQNIAEMNGAGAGGFSCDDVRIKRWVGIKPIVMPR